MKKTIVWIGTVIGVAAVMALAFGALERRATPRTVAVNGECLTTAPRDKTAITLRVSTLAPTAVASMRAATTQMAQITEYLKTQPVEMQTTQFNSYEKTEWNRDEQKSITLGIETTVAVEVSADSIDVIEDVLSRFAGMPNVFSENLRMYTSPRVLQPIMENCLSVAVENARTRANALVAGDGKRTGKLLSVSYGANSDNVAQPVNGLLRTKMVATATMGDASGTIVSRDTDVSVSVSAVFEIK